MRAAAGLFTEAISGAVDMEQAQISFGVLLGSAEDAKSVLEDVATFAAETPFELPELRDSARSLAAFGTASGDIVPELRMIGDIASGIGQPIGELAELYGKARVQGRLFGEDINQLTGRGIPIIGQLAEQFGVNESKIKDLVASGKVGFPQLQQAFRDMTAEGGQFGGMMEAQSQSLGGLWSTLMDNIKGGFRDLAAEGIEAFNVKDMLVGLIEFTGTVRQAFMDVKDFALDAATVIGFAWENMGDIALLAWERAKLGAVSFWEDLKYLFTAQIPNVLTWFADQWQNILFTAVDYGLTLFINLGKNIRALWDGVLDFIAGKGFNVDFTPLEDGFVNSVAALPDIGERELSALEKELKSNVDRIGGQLSMDLGETMVAAGRVPTTAADAASEGGLSTASTQLAEAATTLKELEGPAAVQRGSADAFSQIFAAMRGDSTQDKQLKATEQSLKEEQKQTKALQDAANRPTVELVPGTV